MQRLSGLIAEIIIDEFGSKELLKRLSDAFWLQALGCVLGFDWHSSGLTTTTLAALKKGLEERNLEVKIAGGKGLNALKTPEEIENLASFFNFSTKKVDKLKEYSRLIAKIDNSLVQDGYDLYLHFFIFDKKNFTVVQQGLNEKNKYARRYHWFFEINVEEGKLINEPHSSVLIGKEQKSLNLTLNFHSKLREDIIKLVNYDLSEIKKVMNKPLLQYFKLPKEHLIKLKHLSKNEIKVLNNLSNLEIKDFLDLIKVKGVGKESIRALALTSNLIYGSPISWKDFVKYSFAHGGKDKTPFPIKKEVYSNTISVMEFLVKELRAKGSISGVEERKIKNKLLELSNKVDFYYKV